MHRIKIQTAVGNISVADTDLSFAHFSRAARGLNFSDDQELVSSENAVWDPNTQTWCNSLPVEQLVEAYESFARETFE